MKKKIKLFATIASFCLAVSMLAFGVYAATNVTYTISGSVSYTVNDVLVSVSTQLYQLKTNTKYTASTVASAGDAAWQTSGSAKTWASYDNNTKVFNSSSGSAAMGTLKFSTSYAYKIVVTISTLNTSGTVSATVGNVTTPDNAFIVKPSNGTVTNSKPLTLVYYIGLDDATSPASGTFSLPVTIAFAA